MLESGRKRRWRLPAKGLTSIRSSERKWPGERMKSGGKPAARPCAKPSGRTLWRSKSLRRDVGGGNRHRRPFVRPIGGSAELVAMHGETTLEDLTADQAQAVLDATPQSSRRNVYGAIKRLMDWARRQNLITASPVGLVDPPARPASRERTPSPGEVTAILSAADDLLASGRWRQVQRDGVLAARADRSTPGGSSRHGVGGP